MQIYSMILAQQYQIYKYIILMNENFKKQDQRKKSLNFNPTIQNSHNFFLNQQYKAMDPDVLQLINETQLKAHKIFNGFKKQLQNSRSKKIIKSFRENFSNSMIIEEEIKKNNMNIILPRLKYKKEERVLNRNKSIIRDLNQLPSSLNNTNRAEKIVDVYKTKSPNKSVNKQIQIKKQKNLIEFSKLKVFFKENQGQTERKKSFPKKKVENLESYQIQLYKQMMAYVTLPDIIVSQENVRNLKKKYRYLQGFDKEYFSKQNQEQIQQIKLIK